MCLSVNLLSYICKTISMWHFQFYFMGQFDCPTPRYVSLDHRYGRPCLKKILAKSETPA